ncbi:hypothetical protein Pan153_43110 [Gimesia panareensis]|uniref:PcfJ-like protein n=1 Tax=Gimesia panareensis TaxID=2527978 RepID=A0A518FTN7_9PLAN|nr:PcfJ domain-containing protein [Gimesia panareensis]QDV19645.1 hypothetical protein Pan153_43110 [Gimesia panareensis]
MNSQNRKHHAARCVDALIAQHASSLRSVRSHFWRLIYVIRDRTELLSPRLGDQSGTAPLQAERVIKACWRLACRQKQWQQIPETWSVTAENPFRQIRSLVKHLLDLYQVPDFMAPVWWADYEDNWATGLYLLLARGLSVRQYSLLYPFRVTKKMAVQFVQAPDDLSPRAALRWAQVRALGGDPRLARILISETFLREPTSDEPFWESVIRFLIQQQPISADEIVEIVHFLSQQRFEPAEKVWGKGSGDFPVQPDFSLKGRSLMSLRRHMVHWRLDLIEKGMMPPAEVDPLDYPWQRSAIGEFHCEHEGQIWSIEEVLTPRQLQIESKIMNHCVEMFLNECARRKTTIWSMKVKAGRRRRRQLTIEVLPQKKVIFEARGKNNSTPAPTVRQVLNRWAHQEGLKFSEQA